MEEDSLKFIFKQSEIEFHSNGRGWGGLELMHAHPSTRRRIFSIYMYYSIIRHKSIILTVCVNLYGTRCIMFLCQRNLPHTPPCVEYSPFIMRAR